MLHKERPSRTHPRNVPSHHQDPGKWTRDGVCSNTGAPRSDISRMRADTRAASSQNDQDTVNCTCLRRMPVDLAELLARLSDHRRVDERHTFVCVARQHGVVKRRIHVLPTIGKVSGGQKTTNTTNRIKRRVQ